MRFPAVLLGSDPRRGIEITGSTPDECGKDPEHSRKNAEKVSVNSKRSSMLSVHSYALGIGIVAALMLALGIELLKHKWVYAQGSVTIGTPTLTLADDNCFASGLDGSPNYPDPGDTLTISTTLTNNTGSNAEFRVVVRAEGTTGGITETLPVDLLHGGPTYMNTGLVGGANWDDSYGEVFNTPLIAEGDTYTAGVNFSLLRQQLTEALNMEPSGTTGTITFRVEVFSSDFSIYYGTDSTAQTVMNSNKKCGLQQAPPVNDAAPVILNTNKTRYSTGETIYLEWSVGTGDENDKVPAYGDELSAAEVAIVRLTGAPSGDPELDYTNGVTETVVASWTRSYTTCTSWPCSTTDEDVSSTFYYCEISGEGHRACTNYASLAASGLPGGQYMVRVPPGSGSASHTVQQPQWTYFWVGPPTAISLVSFSARSPKSSDSVMPVWASVAVLLAPVPLILVSRFLRRSR